MRNFLNLVPSVSQYFCSRRDETADPLRWRSPRRGGLRQRAIVFGCFGRQSIAPILLCLAVVSGGVLHPSAVRATMAATQGALAQTPANAPAPLTKLLTEIDAAANRRDVKAVMAFYSQNFTHSDGLNSQSLEKALTQLWQRYPNLNYRTELKSWKTEGNAIIADTVTTIAGTQKQDGRELNLKATIRSQQRFEGEKIVKQEILAEQNQISSGKNPPKLQVNVPEQVKVGEEYNFDAIVLEPIGNDILIGTIVEEPVSEKTFFKSAEVDLDLLNSGGIFKVGKAPATPENRWISAVLMRQGGIAMVSVRLRVVK
ncbi:MAG: nuclear transport factor 2 family protein [Microcoleus sp. PH2017_10_PVI_O_A]|uniref:nuclear transport factor 2 family protein n=1 Tax=unclassified Microcoleus TaxID=2642155 RepID=UPI001DCB01A1|nr:MULTISPECIES: nuclear transport factor 2 family protein [unclassified Microcoleus]TAE79290.1 MAG: nuclear transport factor 2 family protein [Oscillatoriales cyanobacterium]MCC3408409.1 nuclear transport factor 2 family protein [Microcoleus sp. PH2017_10_PVI_O_A]MCC3462491.1 nuclear transport factor 2 family protein [Microcoleus sp. PH2017_11_PCY_U_A]MCC3481994.1 nuclear transport factor 2 family protein [Microcoleus sp. PH2017_12_PCY_D_A]MCC3531177.1 nuclear transport factor 2 family protei